jgi:hypothetical protein
MFMHVWTMFLAHIGVLLLSSLPPEGEGWGEGGFHVGKARWRYLSTLVS